MCSSINMIEGTKNIRQVFIVHAEPEEARGNYANSEVNFWFPLTYSGAKKNWLGIVTGTK